jgi:hypothetical protein
MDKELQTDFQKGATPFDGDVIITSDLLEIGSLQESLLSIVKFLHNEFSSATLLTFEDWHEHDGFITESAPAKWDQLEGVLVNVKTLYDSRQGDTYVRRAYYPSSKEFLLRYYVLEKDEDPNEYPGIWGDFDVISDSDTLEGIVSGLRKDVCDKIERKGAKEYFDQCYAG